MIGCIGAGIILFAGLLWAWLLFDVLDYMNDIWAVQSNGINFPFKSAVDLGIAFFPLFIFIMAFVVAYLYLQKRKRRRYED